MTACTRVRSGLGGVINTMPKFAAFMVLFALANAGLPGTSGFVGEFLTMAGAFQANTYVAFFAATGVILSACYALWLYRRVVFGDLIKESLRQISDMDRREKMLFAPLVVMTILLGVYPTLALDITGPSVAALLQDYQVALAESVTRLAEN